ncbi:AMP-binding protein [Dokdonia sp. Hel_I_53]|uniref:AMP-binding protein n=1 Tax=Dokdonia sp. Hel_I_53 TaxID=1566287 RepID=UPI00119C4A49|nr:AMP-binding protein [Dokdonia sp. Hel_I_53]TVZ51885.1 O-succinylbenzoic acid--CoA ligase [Dokdonia sp. Hel_I_53]
MVELSDKYVRVHPKFKLNGHSYTIASLKNHAYEFIKEGEPYEQSVGEFILEWLDDKKYVFAQTSGSTGAPKSIKIFKIHMVHSAKATGAYFGLPEKTKALLCLPVHYIAGKMMLVRAMVLGWHIDMTQPKSNPIDNVYRRYDFCAMTPLQLDNSLSRLHLLKKLIVGGGAISAPLFHRVQGLKVKVYETYGMTETVTHIAARRVNPKKNREVPLPFKVLPKVTVNADARGCLVIKAPFVSVDPVITNDLVEVLSYKKFNWLGRIDNVINSGGVKLYPEQIEYKLASVISVPYFISSIPDDKLGERIVLFVEQEESFTFDEDLLDKSKFLPFELPKLVISLSSFQRTNTGKIQRGQTLKNYQEGKEK